MTELATNVLSYGDNLDLLRRYLPDASVDLISLDPPFNANRDSNVIFRHESGTRPMPSSSPARTPGTGTRAPKRRADT